MQGGIAIALESMDRQHAKKWIAVLSSVLKLKPMKGALCGQLHH